MIAGHRVRRLRRRRDGWWLLVLGTLAHCGRAPDTNTPGTPAGSTSATPPAAAKLFAEVAAASGLTLPNRSGSATKPFIVEAMGAGACWLDFDRDRRLDLFVVYSATYPKDMPSPPPRDRLYRNVGGGRFEDVTPSSGIDESAWGGGCTAGDFDNDGWLDLYVTNHGRNVLWRNRADGTFADVTSSAGVGDHRWGFSTAFADLDRDGDLDLFVTNYLVFDWDNPMVDGGLNLCNWHGISVFCGPRGLPPAHPTYYQNNGDGTFTDSTQRAGFLAVAPAYGLGVVVTDYDSDGWPDLYIANDATPNHLWRNRGDGTFEDVAFRLGVSYNDRGKETASMGVDAADYDNDGRPDLFVTTFSEDSYTLYHADGDLYTDVSFQAGITLATYYPLGWGARFFDFDNDGDLDLLAVNGHIYPQADQWDSQPPIPYREPPNLLENRDGKFIDVAQSVGMELALTGRGAAVGDHDDDGQLDALIVNIDEPPSLFRNLGGGGHWLGVALEGRASNRDGIGTVITLTATGVPTQRRDSRPSGSYLSGSDPRVHFGLGRATAADLEILWPSGTRQKFKDVDADRYWLAVEGSETLQAYSAR